jgi:uncharacterized protein (TIRG00374 family)
VIAAVQPPPRPSRRRWLLWLLVVGGLWLGISHMADARRLLVALAAGDLRWVGVALAAQLAYSLAFAQLFAEAFSMVGVRAGTRQLLPLYFVSNFASLLVPAAGDALLVDYAGRSGQSRARAAAGVLVARVADHASFGLITAAGVVVLLTHHALAAYEAVAVLALLTAIVAQAALLTVGLWQPSGFRRLLGAVQAGLSSAARKLGREPPLSLAWPEATAAEFAGAAAAVGHHGWGMTRALLIGILLQVLDLATLRALFAAFHQRVHPGVLVTGFAVGAVFWLVPVTPQGVGVVEGMMTLVYTSLGVPLEPAAVVALSFRGLSLYLPVLLGFLQVRRVTGRIEPLDGRTSPSPPPRPARKPPQ